MKILVVKMSSMGDVIHTLPAIHDAAQAIPGITIDWVVEEGFAEIPAWHPAVRRVIPVAIRRWRKEIFPPWKMRGHGQQWRDFKTALQQENYDAVIDAQGLFKSAFIAKLARGPVSGFDRSSVREAVSSFFYNKKFTVSKEQHAVERTRELFAKSLGYARPESQGESGLIRKQFGSNNEPGFTISFLHGTTRDDKHWPDAQWTELARHLTAAGVKIRIPWYSEVEKQRAEQIARVSSLVEVLPKSNLKQLAGVIASSTAFVAVDTGLGHLGAALHVPGLSLYGPTDPARIGAYGANQLHLKKDSMAAITADEAFEKLKELLPKAC